MTARPPIATFVRGGEVRDAYTAGEVTSLRNAGWHPVPAAEPEPEPGPEPADSEPAGDEDPTNPETKKQHQARKDEQ